MYLRSLGEELSLMLINVGGEFHKTYIYNLDGTLLIDRISVTVDLVSV